MSSLEHSKPTPEGLGKYNMAEAGNKHLKRAFMDIEVLKENK